MLREDKLKIIDCITEDQSKSILESGCLSEDVDRGDIEEFLCRCKQSLRDLLNASLARDEYWNCSLRLRQ
jgi:hypothetical protein